jgi:hypothetical protein
VFVLSAHSKSLVDSERGVFEQLNTDPQREGFMLIRSFSKMNASDFPISQFSLADRLSISQPGVGCVISKLIELRAIQKTADARINSKSATYGWTANHDSQKSHQVI